MAKRQSTTEPRNVVRLDGEGKTHGEGRTTLTPLCGLRNHENHTWVATTDAVDCARCITLEAKRSGERERLEYTTRAAETQDEVMSQGARNDLDTMAKGEAPVIPAEVPVIAENGETVTVPVDYDDTSKGRRELDASKGERVIAEDTFRVRKDMRRERGREEYVKAFAMEAPKTAEAVEALIKRLQNLHNGMTGESVSEGFSVEFHEPKNGECPDVEIPPLPQGVNANTWELAHTGNTEGARRYHMARAKEQEEAYFQCSHCGESNQYTMCPCVSVGDSPELETPPF